MKRDLYIWKETCQTDIITRCSAHNTPTKSGYLVSKETYIYWWKMTCICTWPKKEKKSINTTQRTHSLLLVGALWSLHVARIDRFVSLFISDEKRHIYMRKITCIFTWPNMKTNLSIRDACSDHSAPTRSREWLCCVDRFFLLQRVGIAYWWGRIHVDTQIYMAQYENAVHQWWKETYICEK